MADVRVITGLFLREGGAEGSVVAESPLARRPRVIGLHAPPEVQRAEGRVERRGKREAPWIRAKLACAAVRG